MSSTQPGGANPFALASSASTIIDVAVVTSDEEELYATVGASARRPRPGLPPFHVASPGPRSGPDAPPAGGVREDEDNHRENTSVRPDPAVDPVNQSTPMSGLSDSARDGDNTHLTVVTGLANHSTSMSSSIREHVYEGGIRYHAFHDGKYPLPNDEIEQNRDDMKHSMSLELFRGAHFLAPVESALTAGGEVLDLGTGTGIWAMEVGDKYPNTKIVGIDLSPIQPNFVPENVHFFIDDFEDAWVEPEHKYDFIHVRHTLWSVRDRKALYRRALHHLKPGGYIEFQELEYTPRCDDETLKPDSPYALRDYINYLEAGIRTYGSEAHAVRALPDELRAAGFENVKVTTHKCPLGMWPRDKRLRLCGLFLRSAVMDGLRGVSRRPLLALGWTQLQIEMFLVDVRKAILDPNIHAYFTYHDVYGRKPLS